MIDTQYSPELIEQEAQEYWDSHQSFKVTEDLSKEKFYCLSMFPYPSGRVHMGHVRNYSIGDVISRYQRMLGKNVLQPMGWDSFGLPAENAAIKENISPAKWTYENIDYMRWQFKRLGFAYDWRREITTSNPEYYRWEQWLFIKMFEKGLAYRKNAIVNWDPVDKTVLANEQVVDGRGWRSGALVERREIAQWFLKITSYADELLNDLENLTGWPEQVISMQKNWIGRSEGVEIQFDVVNESTKLQIFTTRPDTIMGATYLAIAPEHPLVQLLIEQNKASEAIKSFVEECRHIKVAEAAMATIEKKGIDSGLKAKHPLTNELIPIWIANFVLTEYGSGAVMAVPAHDQRDFEFAQCYQLPIKQVITLENGTWDFSHGALTEKGILVDSLQFTGLDSQTAIEQIAAYLTDSGIGQKKVHYRLRDWGVSRQRYWGTPIPIIHCKNCGTVPVPENDLPVILPEEVMPTEGGSPLKNIPEFYQTNCPQCGEPAFRETDTFDTFVESSWYYARFACVNQNKAILDDRAKYWTPVDQYVGGIEHAVMHLLYARFIHKILRDLGFLNCEEPFSSLLSQGMVLKDGAKMSKSKGNVVDPEILIKKYGADTVRLFMLFAAPPEQSLEWSDSGVEGSFRFLKRLWSFAHNQSELLRRLNTALKDNGILDIEWDDLPDEFAEARRQIHEFLKQCSFDYKRQQYNTVVSGCMKLLNLLHKLADDDILPSTDHEMKKYLIHEGFSFLLRLLAPITPHITHYLWRLCWYGENILQSGWPRASQEALRSETIELLIQVNGKLRSKMSAAADAQPARIEELALENEHIKKFIAGKEVKKIVVVPGKLVNIVVGQ